MPKLEELSTESMTKWSKAIDALLAAPHDPPLRPQAVETQLAVRAWIEAELAKRSEAISSP